MYNMLHCLLKRNLLPSDIFVKNILHEQTSFICCFMYTYLLQFSSLLSCSNRSETNLYVDSLDSSIGSSGLRKVTSLNTQHKSLRACRISLIWYISSCHPYSSSSKVYVMFHTFHCILMCTRFIECCHCFSLWRYPNCKLVVFLLQDVHHGPLHVIQYQSWMLTT